MYPCTLHLKIKKTFPILWEKKTPGKCLAFLVNEKELVGYCL
jgi:hypothetical protein